MYKTILVHLAGTTADECVFSQAIGLARASGAHLECIHVRPSKAHLLNLAASNAMSVGVEPNIGEILEALESGAKERAGKARDTFHKLSDANGIALVAEPPSEGVSAAFIEKTGEEVDVLIEALRGYDVAVVAGGGVEAGLHAGDSARLLIAGGRPLLLSPAEPVSEPAGTIAIAWKPTPEASRALASAMPILSVAKKVVLLTASEGSYDADNDATQPIVSYLAWHGVRAETQTVLPAGRSASEAVMDAVRDLRADMLVMGAYGRGRLSEIVFGGFTQQVLNRTELPVFLMH